MIKDNICKILSLTVLGSSALFSLTASAGGFQLYEANAKSLGNAFAGIAAVAQDSSTEYYNPAGLTLLKKPEISIAGTVVDLDTKGYVDSATSNTSPGQQVSGSNNVSPGGLDFIPSFHATGAGQRILVSHSVVD